MSVEWRVLGDGDAIVQTGTGAEVLASVDAVDAAAVKTYLAVTGNLERWREALHWQAIDGEERDLDRWGALVVSRTDDGEVTFVDPERFWDGVYRWFRSRGVDYNT
jgi:hypothetical protein